MANVLLQLKVINNLHGKRKKKKKKKKTDEEGCSKKNPKCQIPKFFQQLSVWWENISETYVYSFGRESV